VGAGVGVGDGDGPGVGCSGPGAGDGDGDGDGDGAGVGTGVPGGVGVGDGCGVGVGGAPATGGSGPPIGTGGSWVAVQTAPPRVTTPLRAGPSLAVIAMVAAPGPTTAVPVPTCSHGTLLWAVQVHASWVFTPTRAVPPAAGKPLPPLSSVYRQDAAACWTFDRASLTASTAWRAVACGLAATLKARVALPCPLVGDVKVTHGAPACALQAHSRLMVRFNVPVPPSAGTWGAELARPTLQRSTAVGAVDCVDDDPPHAPAHASTASVAISPSRCGAARALM
jgi:hypothetical protein